MGNLGLIILIGLNPHLFVKRNLISCVECMTQLFFLAFFVINECCSLTAMAYDRYMAICKPLLYRVTMSHQVCLMMTGSVYAMGFVGALAHTVCMLRLSFCDGSVINHYMCDIPPLLKLSCTSTTVNELVVFVVVGVNVIGPTVFISYTLIINIFLICSTGGRSKVFSTCSSHINAVSFFFGCSAFMYLKPSLTGSVRPMLNPFIYSLRSKNIHIAMKKMLKNRVYL
uniref:Olfactory receptor family 8 subfamily B member 42 n=1 Tax=Jaculus jaculus TaxID=51337 RepID=A0A8C5KDS9_JACJA